jgi:hypothetical protein
MCPSRTALPMDYRLRPQVRPSGAVAHTLLKRRDQRSLEDKSRIGSARERAACSSHRSISARDLVTLRGKDLPASVPCARKHVTQQLQSGHGVHISTSVPQKHDSSVELGLTERCRRILEHPSMIWGSWCSLAKSRVIHPCARSTSYVGVELSCTFTFNKPCLCGCMGLRQRSAIVKRVWASGVRCHAPARNSYHPWLAGVTDRTTSVRRGRPCRLNVKLA